MIMEDKSKRLKRFQDGTPIEIIDTLLNSIDNAFNKREMDVAAASNLWLLVILGIHAASLTISYGLFDKEGHKGFNHFLKTFIDDDRRGFNFSAVSWEIHRYRNIASHSWLSNFGYEFGLDLDMPRGWEKREKIVFINPKLYYKAYKNAFGMGGKIWQYEKLLTQEELNEAKVRLLTKYEKT